MKTSILFFICWWGLLLPTAVAEESLQGHVKFQPSLSFHPSKSFFRETSSVTHEEEIDLRVNYSRRDGRREVVLHGELLGVGGTSYEALHDLQNLGIGFGAVDGDRRSLFDLSKDTLDDSQFLLQSRIDRASLAWYGDQLVVKGGRQALSFGNGLAFHPLDLFNPFSPTAVDKDYKSGTDLLYAQYLFSTGDDLEFAFIPRRDPMTSDIEEEEFSYVVSGRTSRIGENFELLLLGARHYDEWLFGIGASKGVLGAELRSDVQLLYDENLDEVVVSYIVNLDRSWDLFGRNLYTFIEYFRNGFGESRGRYQEPSASLFSRVERGEVFLQGRDLIAIGARLELTALLNLSLSEIVQANDGSGVSQVRLDYDIYQDVLLRFGFDIPYGPKGSEFGGIEVLPDTYLRPARVGYIRVAWYW